MSYLNDEFTCMECGEDFDPTKSDAIEIRYFCSQGHEIQWDVRNAEHRMETQQDR